MTTNTPITRRLQWTHDIHCRFFTDRGEMGLKTIQRVPPSTSIAGRVPMTYRTRMLHQSTFGNTIQGLPTFIQESEIKQRYRNPFFEACLKQSLVGIFSTVLENLEAVNDALNDVKVMMKKNNSYGDQESESDRDYSEDCGEITGRSSNGNNK